MMCLFKFVFIILLYIVFLRKTFKAKRVLKDRGAIWSVRCKVERRYPNKDGMRQDRVQRTVDRSRTLTKLALWVMRCSRGFGVFLKCMAEGRMGDEYLMGTEYELGKMKKLWS